ncbi:hypothetical protein FNF29_02070 [Cafeteria roenbergensis]|uniref:Spindle assembly abnormal protein 6 N-terminal domain-containing protein n=1 Tax=Cafeteria roenbergensis TaxID=33653 RepID=A0A5A8E2T1_CAFRO|nr:hypothetical protein FNF29_02070 [Cafeteria roenbergensis]KAA0170201.1 hypothetical protein FNF28_01622 [Cafeteria roenbergensis]|eukprot:KAA0154926.1 hypothetical protein FNF29_02070 [Cafeteria roenbergensis]
MSDGFDRAEPLFEGELVVRLASAGPGRDGERPMTVRVLQSTGQSAASTAAAGGTSAPCRCVRLEIADAADPFYLRTLDVSEAEFAELKREQRLMVDFSGFADHLVSLLSGVGRAPAGRRATAPSAASPAARSPSSSRGAQAKRGQRGDDLPSPQGGSFGEPYLATLYDVPASGARDSGSRGGGRSLGIRPAHSSFLGQAGHGRGSGVGEALGKPGASPAGPMFEVVERTAFRDLVHLAVPVSAGDDEGIKSVLAARLALEQRCHAEAAASLREQRALGEELLARAEEAESCLASERAAAAAGLREARAEAAARLAEVREAAARQETTLGTSREQALEELRSRMEREAAQAEAQLEASKQEARALREALSDVRRKLEDAQRERDEARRQAASAQRSASDSEARATRAEARSQELAAAETSLRERVAALAQAAEDRQALAERADETRRSEERGRVAAEDSARLLKSALQSLQGKFRASVAEIHKANEIIKRLDAERREANERRETAEGERREALDRESAAARAAAASRAEAEAAREAAARDRQRRAQAEEAAATAERETEAQREAAAKHARVIEWLNKELTDRKAEEVAAGGAGSVGVGASRAAAGGRPWAASQAPLARRLQGGAASRTWSGAWASPGLASGSGAPGTFAGETASPQVGGKARDDSWGAGIPAGNPLAAPRRGTSEEASPQLGTSWWRSAPADRGVDVPASAGTAGPHGAPSSQGTGSQPSGAGGPSRAATPSATATHRSGAQDGGESPLARTPVARPSPAPVRRVSVSKAGPRAGRSGAPAARSPAPTAPTAAGATPDSALDSSTVSARGAASAAGAPARKASPAKESSNPYMRPNWRDSDAGTASAHFASA